MTRPLFDFIFAYTSYQRFAEEVAVMIKTLTKHGNILALVIEKPILELLGAGAETPFKITTDGHVLILSPVKDAGRREAFVDALDKGNSRYPKALKKLTE